MNCPHCNSPSADGKKFCADCGTPLDSQTAQTAAFVKSEVERTFREQLRDQRVLGIETTQQVVERLMLWAKLFGFFVALPIAVLLLILGIFGIHKFSDVNKMVGDVEKKIQPQINRAKADADQSQKIADEAKAEAEASKQTIKDATKAALTQLASSADLVNKTAQQIQGSKRNVDSDMTELRTKIDAATKEIGEQRQKLASTDDLVKTLFSKGITEYFNTNVNGPTAVTVPYTVGATSGAIVFILLKSAPIYQTVELRWRVASQPHNSYSITNNLVMFNWGESADSLKQHQLEVTYVPDPTVKAAPFKTLSVHDNAVFADDTKVADVATSP